MDALIQLAHLSEEDLMSLSEKVAENLAIAFDSVTHEAAEAKERLKQIEESHIERLQEECARLRSDLDSTGTSLTTFREALSKEEIKCLELTKERDELNKKLTDCMSVSGELELVIKNLENDKEGLNELLNKKISECEQLSAELRELQEEVSSTRRIKSDALTQLEEAKTEKALLASEKYLDLESELASRKVELEKSQSSVAKLEDLVKRLTESNEDHIEKLKILDAQRRLTDLYKDQATEAEKKCEEMQKAVAEMQEMLNQGHEHVIKLQNEKAAFVETLVAEKEKLASQNAMLTNELKVANEIVDKFRIQGLSEEELRQLNPAVATTIASLKRGRSLTQIYSDYVQVVEERDLLKLDNGRLTEHIREMISQLEEKGPLLRSQQEAFYKSKERIAELESQLETALANAKEQHEMANDHSRRSGYYQRQNLRLKQSCKDLSTQVKTLLYELETARGTVIKLTDQGALDAFPDSSTDDTDSRKLLELCSSNNSAAASVIDCNLVTYRSLAELQTQNARLLLVARDLATQLEDHESKEDVLASRVSEITAKVEVLSGEVQVARLAASEARSEAQFAARQRDAFKALLQKHAIPLPDSAIAEGSTPCKRGPSDATSIDNASLLVHPDTSGVIDVSSVSTLDRTNATTSGGNDSQSAVKLEESLCSLHSELKQYREDKAKSDEVYTETIEKLRKEGSEARILNQKLAAQLDFTHEKFRTLEANVANYKEEISILREMNARYTTSAAASDEALTALREQSACTSDRLAAAEVECRQLTRQLEHARANETRLTQELESAQKLAVTHEQLMRQLQSIQNNLEHREEMERMQASRRIAALETELADLRKSSEEKLEKMDALNMTLQSELSHARQALRSAEEEACQLRTAIATSKTGPGTPTSSTDGSSPNARAKPSDQLAHAVGDQTSASAETSTCPENQPSLAQFREVERECSFLRVSLEAVRKQFAEYQQLGSEMEAHIASLTREREELEHAHAAEVEDKNQRMHFSLFFLMALLRTHRLPIKHDALALSSLECELLNMQLMLEKSERQDLVQANARLTDESQAALTKLRADLVAAQAALKDAEARRETALKVEESSRSEVASHQRTAQEAREKYEVELRLHSQDVQLLMEARKRAEEARSEVEGLRTALETAKACAEQSEERSKEQLKLWEEERARFTKRIADADEEVNRLQEQILKLTEQTVNLRKLMERSSDESFPSEELGAQIKASEDFTHVLEYLRRQKSIAEAAEEAANAEVSRLHLRVHSLESRIADLQAQLSEERRESEIRAETSSQHASLMSQIEQVSVLSESNRLLRQERESIRNAAAQAEEQLVALRAEMEPLRIQCKELEDMREILAAEKRSLAEERDRWKERCTRLVETSKRMDPEEYKQACNARDQLQARLLATEEAKASLERESESRIAALEHQMGELSSSLSKLEAERLALATKTASLDEQCRNQQEELSRKQVNIVKLREIGRKYRQESDELRRQLSTTQEKEKSMKTAEEAMVALRADLLNTQANLHLEQEQSTLLRQEINHLEQLLGQAESLPELAAITTDSPQSLIGDDLPPPHQASATYDHLNRLLSLLLAELSRLRSQAEAQSERLLRMQLIESQLTKTKRQCVELKAQLASAMAVPSEPTPVSTLVTSSVSSVATTSASFLRKPAYYSTIQRLPISSVLYFS
ncbi:unnamed protein product [Mesocestoides corti]|uniref:Nucleoprotein TPR n=1 Tax=Mesocestoides corti TaxID=53468 RepID=A0A0R3U556_MESCO|nr:unnamed protein product [Mesocestoides corti]